MSRRLKVMPAKKVQAETKRKKREKGYEEQKGLEEYDESKRDTPDERD